MTTAHTGTTAHTSTSTHTGAGTDAPAVGALTPAQARARFRAGHVSPTSGWADGYTQTNLVAVPRDWAYDLLLFAQRNPRSCPVLDVTDPGQHTTALAAEADLRTDLPRYRVWADGELVDEPADATPHWREDLVTFSLGCSFTFEAALTRAGVPLRHVEQGRNVPMYLTRRQCRPAGRLHGPLVVSMRPITADLVATVVAVTAQLPAVHGAPVHVGDPASLLVGDLDRPDFGDAVVAAPNDVPVFWACGVTPQAALVASRVPFAVTHAPGHMFVTDVPDRVHQLGAPGV